MRISHLLSVAGLVAASAMLPAAANAQQRVVTKTTTTTVHRNVSHAGPMHRKQKVCTVKRRHGHKIRNCVWR